jgi:hypothetical protein
VTLTCAPSAANALPTAAPMPLVPPEDQHFLAREQVRLVRIAHRDPFNSASTW